MRDLGIIAHAGPIDDVQKRHRFDEIIDAENAEALAQFLKRVSFATCERHSTSSDEAHRMMSAIGSLQRAINKAGFNPR